MPISLKISERARRKAENKAKAEEGKAASGKVPQSPPEGAARWNDYAVVWKKHRQKEEKRLRARHHEKFTTAGEETLVCLGILPPKTTSRRKIVVPQPTFYAHKKRTDSQVMKRKLWTEELL